MVLGIFSAKGSSLKNTPPLPRHASPPLMNTPKALDALDSMAFSAMRLCVLSCAYPDRGQGNSALVAALVAEGSSIGGLESEIRVPTSEKVGKKKRWDKVHPSDR